MQALSLENTYLTLHSTSGPVEILKGVNFVAQKGETVAIVGPSGSGKSSLISIAAGLERATAGVTTLLGERLDGRSEDDLARLRRGRVSLVFQSFHLLPTMTAFDNVRAALEIARADNVEDRTHDALGAVGLSARLDHYPGQLSGGEQQRVAIARALAPDPQVIFADEPTGELDAANGAAVADLLFELAQKNDTTLLLVTHDHELAKRADRMLHMHDGRLS